LAGLLAVLAILAIREPADPHALMHRECGFHSAVVRIDGSGSARTVALLYITRKRPSVAD